MEAEITCRHCHGVIEHLCSTDLRRALIDFAAMAVELPSSFKRSGFYVKGDEHLPLLSEAVCYGLFGKEDGRTVLALFHMIARAAGYDPSAIDEAGYAQWESRYPKYAEDARKR